MKTRLLSVDLIDIPEDRQRKDLGDIEDLAISIKARGQINPIVVKPDGDRFQLIAGERRLTAVRHLQWPKIVASLWADLSKDEARLIELEENTKRKDLHWTEFAAAVGSIHSIQSRLQPEWTTANTAEYMGYARSNRSVHMAIATAEKLESEPKIKNCATLESAYNIIARVQKRQLADIINEVTTSVAAPKPGLPSAPGVPPPRPAETILTTSFLEWAPAYSGVPFNFIHCDFPYGIDIGESDQMKHEVNDLYEDSADIYWALLECFAANLDRVCFPSCHLLFWFSMEYYVETLEFLTKKTDFRVFKRPLVWHKSDNAGVIPDARRRPRNTYEVAFMASRGDRFILDPVASSVAAPTASRKIHMSEKPEPMLKHFFRMFVNEDTAILDPTAGSGSSLRAAEAMGAKRLLGLELNPEYARAANVALSNARALRKASAKVGA